MKTTAVRQSTPPVVRDEKRADEGAGSARRNFLVYAANMSWQLAIVVILPIAGGAELDKHSRAGNMWVFVGLGVAFVLSTAVMWRTVQLANRIPVPKLTAAQKREIQRQYEAEDDDE